MQFTPVGPWGVGGSVGPATEGLKGLSGRVQNPNLASDAIRVGKGSFLLNFAFEYRIASKTTCVNLPAATGVPHNPH